MFCGRVFHCASVCVRELVCFHLSVLLSFSEDVWLLLGAKVCLSQIKCHINLAKNIMYTIEEEEKYYTF